MIPYITQNDEDIENNEIIKTIKIITKIIWDNL